MRLLSAFFRSVFIAFVFLACQNPAPTPVTASPEKPGKTVVAAHDPFNRNGRLIFTRHARCRMDCRHITKQEIQEVLDSGTINYAKSEPYAKPDPKYAVEANTAEHQHLRIVIAPSGEKLIVITCIELNVEWQCHCN
ncbi:MAG: DUF4258 domain-containing protein [Bacteroidota bacterium]|nr:DUF4258 domain-containing protein [Bacteroidota bacterium]